MHGWRILDYKVHDTCIICVGVRLICLMLICKYYRYFCYIWVILLCMCVYVSVCDQICICWNEKCRREIQNSEMLCQNICSGMIQLVVQIHKNQFLEFDELDKLVVNNVNLLFIGSHKSLWLHMVLLTETNTRTFDSCHCLSFKSLEGTMEWSISLK